MRQSAHTGADVRGDHGRQKRRSHTRIRRDLPHAFFQKRRGRIVVRMDDHHTVVFPLRTILLIFLQNLFQRRAFAAFFLQS